MMARTDTVYVIIGQKPFLRFRDLNVWCECHDCQWMVDTLGPLVTVLYISSLSGIIGQKDAAKNNWEEMVGSNAATAKQAARGTACCLTYSFSCN